MSLGADWGHLGGDELAIIDAARVTREFRRGETIFHEGAPCAGLYCVEDGLVCTRKMDSVGNAILLRLNYAGDLLGHCAVLAGAEYKVTAEALEPTRACFIDTATVRTLLGRSTGLALNLLQRLAADLDDAEEQVLRVTTLPVRARVAHLLLVLKDRYGQTGSNGGFRLRLPLSRQDMASMIGIRPESMSRTIRGLQADGIARFSGRVVHVPKTSRLRRELSGGGTDGSGYAAPKPVELLAGHL